MRRSTKKAAAAAAAYGQAKGLWVGTMNVRAIGDRRGMEEAIKKADEHGIQVLMIQETRLSENNAASFRAAARSVGWRMITGPFAKTAAGHAYGGVAALAKWPVERAKLPRIAEDVSHPISGLESRFLALRVHRPGDTPLLVVNVYLQSGDPVLAAAQGERIAARTKAYGGHAVIIGDWNAEPDQAPALPLTAGGAFFLCDEVMEMHPERTRPDGRYVDYAIATQQAVPQERVQHSGVADHDLVGYRWNVHELEPSYSRPPTRKLRKDATFTEEEWHDEWAAASVAWEAALVQGKTKEALAVYYDCLEKLLVDTDGDEQRRAPRSSIRTPKRGGHGRRRGELEPVRVRRVRRLQRRAAELSRCPNAEVEEKQRKQCAELGRLVPELLEEGVAMSEEALRDVAERLMNAEHDRRIAEWRERMDGPKAMAALCRWVKRSADPDAPVEDGKGLHPSARCADLAWEWGQRWNPSEWAPPSTTTIDAYAEEVAAGARDAPDIQFSKEAIRRVARAMSGKAAGTDGWSGSDLSKLPLEAYQPLAQLWTAVWAGASVPQQWWHVRMCFIPRQIGIAQLAWRIGLKVIIGQITEWLLEWVPPELCGGIPQRDMRGFMEELFDAVDEALRTGRPETQLAGCKIDFTKFFDTLSTEASTRILETLRAPPRLVELLRLASGEQVRWIDANGYSHHTPVTTKRGVIAGCPASMMQTAAVMACWVMQVRQTRAKAGAFVDDRSLWGQGVDAARHVEEAVRLTAAFDRDMRLEWNLTKGETFGSNPAVRAELREVAAHVSPLHPPKAQFELLGTVVHIHAGARTRRADVKGKDGQTLEQRITKVLRRIPIATRNCDMRRMLVQMLVGTCVTWNGGWTRPPTRTIQKWACACEAAVLGSATAFRSRLLAWTGVLDCSCDPEFLLHRATLRLDAWRGRRATEAAAGAHATGGGSTQEGESQQQPTSGGDEGEPPPAKRSRTGRSGTKRSREADGAAGPRAVKEARKSSGAHQTVDETQRGVKRKARSDGGRDRKCMRESSEDATGVPDEPDQEGDDDGHGDDGEEDNEHGGDRGSLDGASMRARRLREALDYFGWERVGAGRYGTQAGCIDFNYEGRAAQQALMKQSWARRLARREARAKQGDAQAALTNGFPRLAAHGRMQSRAPGRNSLHGKTAAGCAPDGRTYAKFWPLVRCRCGQQNPTRRHMLWQCSATQRERDEEQLEQPLNSFEEGLQVRCTPTWRREGALSDMPEAAIAELAREMRTAAPGQVLVATDGGSDGRHHEERVATWAVSISGAGTRGGLVPGLDGTPRAAEHYAVDVAVAAAALAGRDLLLLVDNLGVRNRAEMIFRGARPNSAWHYAFWRRTAANCMGRSHRSVWIPSHGKRPDWQPPADVPASAAQCRGLNKRADEECTAQAEAWKEVRRPFVQAREEAEAWSAKALRVLLIATQRLHEDFREATGMDEQPSSGGEAQAIVLAAG